MGRIVLRAIQAVLSAVSVLLVIPVAVNVGTSSQAPEWLRPYSSWLWPTVIGCVALVITLEVVDKVRLPAATTSAAAGKDLPRRNPRSTSGQVEGRPGETVAVSQVRVVPRQLPAAVQHFAGRASELAALTGLLSSSRETSSSAVVISAIGGTAGVGKSALALYWAHQVRDQFPDGQLFVNLRGFDPCGKAMDSGEAVRWFLDALDVPPQRIPSDPHAQAALLRSQMAERRMLIVLDNARNSAQVRPLLPGTPGSMVVVTSRNRLSGLVAVEGADSIDLDLLSAAEARELLARRIGSHRLAAEPEAVTQIITACAQLPLALAIVAANAAGNPRLSLAAVAGQMREPHDKLGLLVCGDDTYADVRAVLSWSYESLSPNAARMFRLLGLHPGPDISVLAAASLAGIPIVAARGLLTELGHANLIVEHTYGRYTFHDLLRAYATELTRTRDTDQERREATHRMLDHYLQTADAANRLLEPAQDPIHLTSPRHGTIPEHLADHGQAMAWFTAEHAVLLAAIDHAATTAFDTHTWQLAWTLWTFLDRRGHWNDLAAAGRAAVAAAGRLANPPVQARPHRNLAAAYIRLGRLDDAYIQLQHALDLSTQAGDLPGQPFIHYYLALVLSRQGHHADALTHAQQALDLARATGHRHLQGRTLNAVGEEYAMLGDCQKAITYCHQGLTLLQELNDPTGQADVWEILAYAHLYLGQYDQALACSQNALDLSQHTGHRYNEANILCRIGDIHHAGGNALAARNAWQQSLIVLQELDHPDAGKVHAKLSTH